MSESAPATVKVRPSGTAPSLQRKCACGRSAASLIGDCPDCQREKAKRVQKKLLVGSTDDPLEHEADRAAERVLSLPLGFQVPRGHALPPLHASPPQADSAASPQAQAQRCAPAAATGPPLVAPMSRPAHRFKPGAQGEAGSPHVRGTAPRPSIVHEPDAQPPHDEALTQGGSPLDADLRGFFETRYGRDLSDVRIHTGLRSESLNDGLNAHAFTYDSHVWLGRGHRPRADFLLAHELAHVIQQREPKLLNPQPQTEDAAGAPSLSESGRVVRRLELSDAFWVPLGAKGRKTGKDIHEEVLAVAQANNTDLDVEAPAPNGTADGWGLGLQGSIDLYKGTGAGGVHSQVGLFFDGPTGAQVASVPPAVPTKHKNVSKTKIASGRFNPFVTAAGGIDGIANGPTSVEIGELKPAAMPLLDKAKDQIENYQHGMVQAAKLTNEWARNAGSRDQWNLTPPSLLPDGAVKFGTDMTFNPASPREDESLVLARISEKSGGVGYRFRTIFNPAAKGLPEIKGGLYAQLFRAGQGLWTYFARPKDLSVAVALAKKAVIKAEMAEANLLQDKVIDPLFKPPVKTTTRKAPLLRNRVPLVSRDVTPVIRRAPTTPELKDEFKFADWKKNQEALRNDLFGPTTKDDTQKKMASLELLEEAYKADDTLDKALGTKHSKLPPKSANVVNIFTGKGADRKLAGTRNLSDMASWLKGWTSKPAEALGFFRDKFGDTFVVVANKLVALRDRIREKWRKAFEAHPAKPGGSRGKIIAKALLKALHQVAKVLIPRAVHLFMDAVVAGIKKKLSKVFDIDPIKMAEDTFGEDFKQWSDKLTKVKDDAETHVTTIVDTYTKEFAWIKDLMDAGTTIGRILEIMSIAIQCGKKPGWNCLLLLSKQFRECGMETALNICDVQKEIASIVALVGPLADLPATLAQTALDVVKDASPDALKDVFSETVAKSGAFNNAEIDCEDSPSELLCPGLIPSSAPGKGLEGKEKGGDSKTEDEQKKDEPPGPQHGKHGKDARPKPGEEGSIEGPPGSGGEQKEKRPPTYGDDPGTPRVPQGPDDQPGVYGPHGGQGEGHGKPSNATGGTGNPQGAPGAGQGGGKLPTPDEVHKALNDLLNDQGPEGLEALAKLAEAAGMPGDAPLTAEQVKKLQELLKRGTLTPKDLQDLAGGQPKPDVGKKGRPLGKFLEQEAHGAVLDQTLDKLRRKQYEYKFREMARLKMHWKILLPYKPGPFRNAPALMWDDTIRAAGVVDGEYGQCYDAGKIPLTITKADMREEGTEKPVIVHTPFSDKSAQIAGDVCPSPPSPPKGVTKPKDQKGGGPGQGQGQGQGQKDDSSGGKGGTPKQGDKPAKPPDQGKIPPSGENDADPGSEVDSGVKPGDAGAQPKGGADKDEGKDDSEAPEQEQKDVPSDQKYSLDVAGLGAGCGLPAKCAAEPLRVDFEELGTEADGYQVMPDKDQDLGGTKSLLNPPNKQSPFSMRNATDGSQDQEMILTCEGKTCVVGRVRPSSVRAGMVELVSGPLLDSLRALLRRFLTEKRQGGNPNRVDRLHFF